MSLLTKASTVTTPTAYSEGLLHSVKPVEILGSEEVTNGSFDTDSDWSKGTGWTISGGKARASGVSGSNNLTQSGILTAGKIYKITITVSEYVSGTVEVSAGASPRGEIDANGTYTFYQTATPNTSFYIISQVFNGAVDNVSVKEVLENADFSFARASSATRVNEQGYIEKGRENLLLQSNSFDTTWTTSSVSVTGGQSGYDGSSDAWLITKSASYARIYQTISVSGVQTYSVYAKVGSLNWVALQLTGGVSSYVYFNLSAGTIGTNVGTIDANIEDVGSGWYRCSITYNGSATDARIYPSQGDNDSSGTSGNIYIQDAQLEQGLVATDYIETTTSSVAVGITNDIPRINYEGGVGNFLLEPQRTNRLIHSEYFGDWQISGNITISTNGTTSPEGLQNASIIDFSSATSASNGVYVFAGSPSSAPSRTIYLKGAVGGETLDFSDPNQGGGSNITLTTEWQRFEFTGGNAALCGIWLKNSVGNIIHAYGAQVEEGSYPTSYIPSYGSTVTRAAETCNNAGNSDLFNDSEGVLYAEMAALADDATNRRISISDGTTSNLMYISYKNYTNQIRAEIISSGSTVFDTTYSSINITIFSKIALKYKQNDFSLYIDGFEIALDTSGNTPSGLSKLSFDRGDNADYFYGKTKMVSTFTEALSDSELECLTSWSSFNRMATAQGYTIE